MNFEELKFLRDRIKSGKYEMTPEGLLLGADGLLARGEYRVYRNGVLDEVVPNLIVTEGLNYLVGVALKGVTPVTSWYVALFSGNVSVQAAWTAANFTAGSTEFTAYSQATRVAWVGGSVAAGAVNNTASKASFTINSDTQTVRGAALLSASAKSSTTGTLLGAARFTSDKVLDTDEVLDIGYGLTLSAA